MSPFLQLVFVLAVVLLASNLAGHLSIRLKQPSVLGKLLVGLIFGPSLLDLTHLPFITDPHLPQVLSELAELGVLLLMFLAGLELELHDLRKSSRVAALAGTFGVVMPVLMGFLVGLAFNLPFANAIFLGLTLGATSVSISAQTLIEFKALRSRVGSTLLGAAVFDDILVILLLSTFVAVNSGGNGIIEVLLIMGKMIIFLGLSMAFGFWVLPKIVKFIHRMQINQGVITIAIVLILIYGLAAEIMGGMAAITGAFIAGLMFARTHEKHEIIQNLHSLAYAFFIPIFFVNIGLAVDLRSLDGKALGVFFTISAVAVFSKIFGAGLGSKIGKLSWIESLQVGIGMVSRGEVGLIVAIVGLNLGFISKDLFTSIVGMVILTTLISPIMLRASFRMKSSQPTGTPSPQTLIGKGE